MRPLATLQAKRNETGREEEKVRRRGRKKEEKEKRGEGRRR